MRARQQKRPPRKASSAKPPRSRRPKRVGKKGAPAPRKTGCPPVLSLELTREIAKSLRAGNYIETAAALAGVDRDSIYEWMKRGVRAKRSGRDDLSEHEQMCVEFSGTIKAAQAEAESKAVRRLTESKDWRAAAWWLERTRSGRFSAKQTLRVGSAGAEPGELDLSKLSTEELEQFLSLMAKTETDDPPAIEQKKEQ